MDGHAKDVAKFMAMNVGVFASLAFPIGVISGTSGASVQLFALTAAIGTLVGVVLSVVSGAWSYYRVLPISYEVTSRDLIVRRHNQVIKTIQLTSIVTFSMAERVDVTRMYLVLSPPPPWPHGVLTVREEPSGRSKVVGLPSIILWGTDADKVVDAFRLAIRHAHLDH